LGELFGQDILSSKGESSLILFWFRGYWFLFV